MMKLLRGVGRAFVLCALLAFTTAGSVAAENVTVTIGVGDTILSVTGQTSPNAFVTISKDGNVIGTTTAAADGTYSQTYPAQEPGIHQLSVFAYTPSGKTTDTVTIEVNIAEHATTSVEVFLPPTIEVEDTSLDENQRLVLGGETAPSATVTIFIDNADYAMIQADAQGLWYLDLATDPLAGGQHQLFARATNGFGEQSYPTTPRYFTRFVPVIAPIPPSPLPVPAIPKITFPPSGTIWREPQITIQGTGAPGTQIELWDGARRIGAVWSDAGGTWAIRLTLEAREYSLRVRACLEGRCSAFSPTIHFTYEAAGSAEPRGQPLQIHVPQTTLTIYQYQPLTLRAFVLNGRSPYKTTILWGELAPEKGAFTNGELAFNHRYATPGKYTVTLDVQDADGRTGRVHFAILVKPQTTTHFFDNLLWLLAVLLLALLILLAARQRRARREKEERRGRAVR